jgi:hypothetical protein
MKTITELEFWNLSMKERDNFTGIIKWENDSISYLKNGFLHREDGPAYIDHDCREYWFNGTYIKSKEAFEFLRDLYKFKNIIL